MEDELCPKESYSIIQKKSHGHVKSSGAQDGESESTPHE